MISDTRLNREILASAGVFTAHGDSFSMEFTFGPGFVGFEGHFPNAPILPAMVQLMTGAAACGQAAGKPLAARTVSRAKFLKPVLPGQHLEVHGSLSRTDGGYTAAVKIISGQDLASSFQMQLDDCTEAV